jgi:hypothetical protein
MKITIAFKNAPKKERIITRKVANAKIKKRIIGKAHTMISGEKIRKSKNNKNHLNALKKRSIVYFINFIF